MSVSWVRESISAFQSSGLLRSTSNYLSCQAMSSSSCGRPMKDSFPSDICFSIRVRGSLSTCLNYGSFDLSTRRNSRLDLKLPAYGNIMTPIEPRHPDHHLEKPHLDRLYTGLGPFGHRPHRVPWPWIRLGTTYCALDADLRFPAQPASCGQPSCCITAQSSRSATWSSRPSRSHV